MKTAAKTARPLLQAREFAARAGVTVRTLHHYDQVGLLKPRGYTASGYRLYGDEDLIRLQQIVTLKFLGFPLKRIQRMLDRDGLGLQAMLRVQREILEEKSRHLERAIRAIEFAETQLRAGKQPDGEAFTKIIEVIQMQSNVEWMKSYFTEDQKEFIENRKKLFSEADLQKVQEDWAVLFQEIEAAAAAGVDPAGAEARGFVARWNQLLSGFTGGNAGIQSGLNSLYADTANYPAGFTRPWSDTVDAFIKTAMKATS